MYGVSVVKNDKRRVAAQFHRDALQLRCRGLCEVFSDSGRACEREFAHVRMGAKHVANGFRVTGRDEVGDAGWKAYLMKNIEDGHRT